MKSKVEFMQLLSGAVRNRLGEGTSVRIHRVKKNNGVELDGITILQQGQNIAPAIYLEPYYEQYCEGETIFQIADRVIEVSREFSVGSLEDPADAVSFPRIRERLRFKLINYEMNRRLLRGVPHVSVLDLAKVYYYGMDIPGVERATVLVKRRDLMRWNVPESEVAEAAERNMREKEKGELFVLREGGLAAVPWGTDDVPGGGDADPGGSNAAPCGSDAGPGSEIADSGGDAAGSGGNVPLLLLTSKTRLFGAACLLFDDMLHRVAERLKTDLFVLPSSVHEVLLTPDNGRVPREELQALVWRINRTDVPPMDVLSDNVYRYSRKEGLRM